MKFRIDKKYIHWGMTAFSVIAASIFLLFIVPQGKYFQWIPYICFGHYAYFRRVAFILSAYPDIKRSGKAVPDTVVHKISYRC